MRPVFLKGMNIFLSPLSEKHDLKAYAQWINDQDTTLFMSSGRFPLTIEDLKAYIRSHRASSTGMLLGIFTNKGKKHIGNITLHLIDWRNRNGEIGIIIGDPGARGKGYSKEAISLIVGHAFGKLNLHKLCAGMVEGNEASRRAFINVGFVEEGFLKEQFLLNGQYFGCHRLGMINTKPADVVEPASGTGTGEER